MSAKNTLDTYGSVARTFHWLTALLILTNLPLGIYANDLPYDTGDALAWKAQVFSVHKTLGVAVFATALLRIVWALMPPRPLPVSGQRWETLLAGTAHWVLYGALVVVPLTGWVHHAATDGFAPILWPLGQDLPFVPTSETVAQSAGALHWVFTKVLAATILLHVAGALKHAVIDRDGTLARMVRGTRAAGPRHLRSRLPLAAALGVYAAGAAVAWALVPAGPQSGVPTPALVAAPKSGAATGNWQVTEGTLSIGVRQMGATVSGSFASWQAAIAFDETVSDGAAGSVTVTVDVGSLTLGSVGAQATGAEFLDAAGHPTATFEAALMADGGSYLAGGTLTLRGRAVPLDLQFVVTIDGDVARMTGSATVDRRDFEVGTAYPDESTVGFPVVVDIALSARRAD